MNIYEFLESINQEKKQFEERLKQDKLRVKFCDLLTEIIDYIINKSYYNLTKKLISQVPVKTYLETTRYYIKQACKYEPINWDENKYHSAISTLEDDIFNMSNCDYLIDEYIKIIVKYKNI